MGKKNSTGEEIYSGLATFGKIEAVVGAVVATILSIILVAVGAVMLRHRSHLKSVEGKVTKDSRCNNATHCDGNNCSSTYSCTTDVEYVFNGKTHSEKISTGDRTYSKGDSISVYLDPNNPDKAEGIPAPSWVGWVIIGTGVMVLVGSWSWVYVTRKSKAAAAAGGVAAGIGMISSAVRY